MNGPADVMRAITSMNPLERLREIHEEEAEKDKRCSAKEVKSDPE